MSDTGSNPAWQRNLALLALPAFALFALGMSRNSQFLFSDGDTNWHVATGRWILAHRAVPTTDPFSYTAPGHPWVAHEWLSEVFMALAYDALGWGGVALLTSLAAASTAVLLTNALMKRLNTLPVIVALFISGALFLPHFLARPHILALPLLVIWTLQLMKARSEDRVPAWWMLPLMALWANLHLSFIFGLAFTSFFALEAVLAARNRAEESDLRPPAQNSRLALRMGDRLKRETSLLLSQGVVAVALRWGAFLAGSIVMALLTPGGPKGLLHLHDILSMKYLSSISEFRPENFQEPSALQFAVFATLAICLHRGVRIGAAPLALLLVLVYSSFQHWRQEFILAVTAPLLLAAPLAQALETKVHETSVIWRKKGAGAPIAVIALLFFAVAAIRLTAADQRADQVTVPVSALAHVPQNLRAKPVFNDYSFGGWLIFQGVKPFMDGRSDMYGDDLLKLYLDVSGGDPKAFDTASKQYNIQWTILAPSSPLVKLLDKTPGWRRLYSDKWAVVQTRVDPPLGPGGRPGNPKI